MEYEASVLSALKNGYRLLDTANAYVNEKAVGRGMKKSGIPREEIFLETKLWPTFYEQPDAVENTLERLGTDYIDLLLIHQPAGNYIAGYKLMEKAYKVGKVKAIGLSNFTVEQMQEILDICEIGSFADRSSPLFPGKRNEKVFGQTRYCDPSLIPSRTR